MNVRALRAVLVAALAALALSACAPAQEDTGAAPASLAVDVFDGTHVGGQAFAEAAQSEDVIIVDVRTPAEFAEGYVPRAVNIDVSSPDFVDAVAQLDPDASYAVYCRSGNRSRVAIDHMTAAGLGSTLGLEGGIGAWHGDLITD
ncbi:MAG: rhodanese-like domain-containing protein [Demequina sp.]